MKDIKVGVIGAGAKGQHHLRSLQNIIRTDIFAGQAKIELLAVADTVAARAREVAGKFQIPEVYKDGFDLLEHSGANVVYVCTPTKFHKDLALDTIVEGKDVYCEKPVAASTQDIYDLIRARDEQKGVLVQVGLETRSHPLIPYLQELMRGSAGDLGRLMNVHYRDTQLKPYVNDPQHPSTWRKDKGLAYHGVIFEHSVHDLDAFLHLLGGVRRVFATAKYVHGHDQIEDSATVTLDLQSGATVNMTAVWNNVALDERSIEFFWENAFLRLRYSTGQTDSTFRIGTEDAAPLNDLAVLGAFVKTLGIPNFDPIPVDSCRYANVRWVDSLIKRVPAQPALEDALSAQGIVEAIYESAESGKVIEIAK